ncbi:MAG: SPOR domain-containing protein, partial [Sphingomonas sp.]
MADEMDLREPYASESDRLPWLETVEPDEKEGPSIGRIVALVLLGLVVIAGVVFAAIRLQRPTASGDGQLIAAQEGDYKVRPDEPGGLKVEGEGDSAIATSAGKGAGNGAIDLRAVPEAPVASQRPPAATPAAGAAAKVATAAVPKASGRLVAAAPLTASRPAGPGSASGGS